MDLRFASLQTCSEAQGLVVVIDVVRAFSTSAYAFAAGAEKIILVSTLEEALKVREQIPGALCMGESGGLPVADFDLWNSPSQMQSMDLRGKTLIQRTSAGTQGIVRSVHADCLLAGSFVIAAATARAILQMTPELVTFVATGTQEDDPRFGREDYACAEYIAALVKCLVDGKEKPEPTRFMDWEGEFLSLRHERNWPETLWNQFLKDLSLCRIVDRFSFAQVVHRQDYLAMTPEFSPVF
jgi:2-phosphosulfolactate phosphatase